MVVLRRGFPDQQAQVAQALERHVQSLGLQTVKQLIQVFALQASLRLSRHFQEDPHSQTGRCLPSRQESTQCIDRIQALPQRPAKRRLRSKSGISEIPLEGVGLRFFRRVLPYVSVFCFHQERSLLSGAPRKARCNRWVIRTGLSCRLVNLLHERSHERLDAVQKRIFYSLLN